MPEGTRAGRGGRAIGLRADLDALPTAPDVVIVPSAYSDGLFGVWKGFSEMQEARFPWRDLDAEPVTSEFLGDDGDRAAAGGPGRVEHPGASRAHRRVAR